MEDPSLWKNASFSVVIAGTPGKSPSVRAAPHSVPPAHHRISNVLMQVPGNGAAAKEDRIHKAVEKVGQSNKRKDNNENCNPF